MDTKEQYAVYDPRLNYIEVQVVGQEHAAAVIELPDEFLNQDLVTTTVIYEDGVTGPQALRLALLRGAWVELLDGGWLFIEERLVYVRPVVDRRPFRVEGYLEVLRKADDAG